MKIISLQKNLKNNLYAVNHIAQKNISLPILNNVLISARDGVIKLITTNLEIGITSILRGKIEEDGAYTVDAKILSEYVNLLDNDKAVLENSDSELKISCGSYKTKIKGLAADEFPLIPVIDRQGFIKIATKELKEALNSVVFSVASDETRAELSGVLFSLDNKTMAIVGTDSYRLAEKKVTVENNLSENRQLIIPAKTIQEVIRIISSESEEDENTNEVLFYASDNQCLFVIGNTEIVSRLIDGRYPDYQQIIPQKYQCRATVAREEIIRAIKAAAIFSRTGVNDIILNFSKNGLDVSAASGQTGEQNALIKATISGSDTNTTLNFRYILDGLNAFNSAMVSFDLIDDQTPCVLRDEDNKDYLYIMMPIKK
jgi:DNA polymerase-3 subunit beta